MKTKFIHPAQALSSWLVSGLDRCNQALFTVAYLSEEGVETFAEALGERLKRKRALVRILFQDHGFRTDPAAIRALLEAADGKPGSLKLRFAGPDLLGLHAKAYGFKKGKEEVEVILGSSNIGGKALGTDSGELNVHLGGVAANEAWAAMEDYWYAGYAVTPRWLERYSKAHAKHRKAAAKAEALAKMWKSPRRRPPKPKDLWMGGVFVEPTEPLDPSRDKAVDEQIEATKAAGVEVSPRYVTYGSKSAALHIARQVRVLEVRWRSKDTEDGLSHLVFADCGRAIRVGNERLGTTWIVPRDRVRGTLVTLRAKDAPAVEKALKKSRLDYDSFARLCGPLRKRAKNMKVIYTALKKIASK